MQLVLFSGTTGFRMIQIDTAGTTEQLFPLFYAELRRIAQHFMIRERSQHTLTATALVHESYLRLRRAGDGNMVWNSRSHFRMAAAEAMRRTLVDHARGKTAKKRHAVRQSIGLDSVASPQEDDLDWLLDLDDGIENLRGLDPRAAELVALHLFGGLSIREAGQAVGLSNWGSYQTWKFAAAWFETTGCKFLTGRAVG